MKIFKHFRQLPLKSKRDIFYQSHKNYSSFTSDGSIMSRYIEIHQFWYMNIYYCISISFPTYLIFVLQVDNFFINSCFDEKVEFNMTRTGLQTWIIIFILFFNVIHRDLILKCEIEINFVCIFIFRDDQCGWYIII